MSNQIKAIIIGPSLVGKSTTIKHLKDQVSTPISEIDDELSSLNNGVFPDEGLKQELAQQIIQNLLTRENIIFFSNTDYFSDKNLEDARKKVLKLFN